MQAAQAFDDTDLGNVADILTAQLQALNVVISVRVKRPVWCYLAVATELRAAEGAAAVGANVCHCLSEHNGIAGRSSRQPFQDHAARYTPSLDIVFFTAVVDGVDKVVHCVCGRRADVKVVRSWWRRGGWFSWFCFGRDSRRVDDHCLIVKRITSKR